jgi:membrane-bound lytic murein transglycosylase D
LIGLRNLNSAVEIDEKGKKMKIYIVLFFALLISCSQQKLIKEANQVSNKLSPPDSLFILDSALSSVDSIQIYYNSAKKFLNNKDTVGANIYFEHAFEIVNRFDENTKSVLMEWKEYDSLLQSINEDYSRIQDPLALDFEAEEIREDLVNYEEEIIGDSILTDSLIGQQISDSISIPLVINRRVELALKYFQTKGRKVFSVWLTRLGKYEDLILNTLRDEGLPEELLYLSMIESGFNPKAYSYARASGLWQFIYATGSHYGLRADWWFDERRDPTLSTRAAAKHLKDLYERFDDWHLAMAGYNYSPGKLQRHINRYNTRDFWKLQRLPRQTKNYIPTFIAAAIIAKEPKKYGFFVDKMEPVEFDTVRISDCVDLEVIANCVNSTFDEIKTLNPAVLRWCTPPNVKNFTVNIPKGTKELFKQEYSKIPDEQKVTYKRHKIRSGETLSGIASKYATSISVLKRMNNMRSNLIRAGKYLIIPVAQNDKYYKTFKPVVYKSSSKKRTNNKPVDNVKGHKKIIYTVKSGDTLGDIAELYNTRASKIRHWNGIAYGRHIYPNQKLAIWVPDNNPVPKTINSDNLTNSIAANESYYIVQSGDTLWEIAQKHKTTIRELKRINNLRSNKIRPGERLLIKK